MMMMMMMEMMEMTDSAERSTDDRQECASERFLWQGTINNKSFFVEKRDYDNDNAIQGGGSVAC